MGEFLLGTLAVAVLVGICFMWVFGIADLFLRHDLKGWQKAAWLLGFILFPALGVIVYLIARPHNLGWWSRRGQYVPPEEEYDIEDVAKLDRMRTDGILSQREYEDIRDRTIVGPSM
jgi:hypothetical protein